MHKNQHLDKEGVIDMLDVYSIVRNTIKVFDLTAEINPESRMVRVDIFPYLMPSYLRRRCTSNAKYPHIYHKDPSSGSLKEWHLYYGSELLYKICWYTDEALVKLVICGVPDNCMNQLSCNLDQMYHLQWYTGDAGLITRLNHCTIKVIKWKRFRMRLRNGRRKDVIYCDEYLSDLQRRIDNLIKDYKSKSMINYESYSKYLKNICLDLALYFDDDTQNQIDEWIKDAFNSSIVSKISEKEPLFERR